MTVAAILMVAYGGLVIVPSKCFGASKADCDCHVFTGQ